MTWLTMAKVMVPKKIPTTEPNPTVSSTPPTTTEMIALKMKDWPPATCAELYRIARHIPTKAAEVEDSTNSVIVSRSVGIPALRAETLSPPIAKIQFPKREKWTKKM